MRDAGIKVAGSLDDLLGQAEVVVDCTIALTNAALGIGAKLI